MKPKSWQKDLLSMLVIAGGGFILFNLAFMLAAIVINGTSRLIDSSPEAPPSIVGLGIYLILIVLLSWFVFRSKLNDLAKATFLTVPLMVVLMMVGVQFNLQSKWMIAAIGVVIVGAVLLFLLKKKLSWLYYFATLYVTLLALYVMFSGMEI